jgi:hypothetical protein
MDLLREKHRSQGYMLRDNWGGSSSNEGGSSTSVSGSGAGSTGGWSTAGGGGVGPDGTRGTSAGLANITPGSDVQNSWSIDSKTGQVVGNIQAAASALGVKPSQLSSMPSYLRAMFPMLGLTSQAIGALQDAGLPGYAMTPEERAAAQANASHGGNARTAYDLATSLGGGNTSQSALDAILGSMNHDANNTAQTGWDRWLNVDQPTLDGIFQRADATAQNASNQFATNAANDYADYNQYFRPQYQKLGAYVDQLGSADFMEQQRQQAMEGVQAQADSNQQALIRKYRGMGIGSGALQDALASQASEVAKAKVAAATNSDNTLRTMYGNALGSMGQLGLNLQSAGDTSQKNGIAAGLSTADLATNNAKLGLSAAQTTGSIIDSHTNAATGKQNAATNATSVANANDPWTTVLGAGLGAGISAGVKSLFA